MGDFIVQLSILDPLYTLFGWLTRVSYRNYQRSTHPAEYQITEVHAQDAGIKRQAGRTSASVWG